MKINWLRAHCYHFRLYAAIHEKLKRIRAAKKRTKWNLNKPEEIQVNLRRIE